MKHKLYSLLLAALMCAAGMPSSAQELPKTDIEGVAYYEIASAQDLLAYRDLVNGGETGANAILTADIALSEPWETAIGLSNMAFTGIFDGQGHSITGFEGEATTDGFGIFGYTTSATIKNFSVDGKLTSTAGTGSGIVGYPSNSFIYNVHSSLIVDVPVGNVHHVGGVVGSARGGNVISHCSFSGKLTVDSSTDNFAGVVSYLGGDSVSCCANYGTVIFRTVNSSVGGVAGYLNNTTSYLQNCLNVGPVILEEEDASATPKYGSAFIGRIKNNYDPAKITGNVWLEGSAYAAGRKDDGTDVLAYSSVVTAEQLKSGEACFLLNGDQSNIQWYQTIGTDELPTIDPTHGIVYMNGRQHCDGTAYEGVSFSNENTGLTKDDHDIVDGFCTYCGAIDVDYLAPDADGYFEIGDARQLVWFAGLVKSGVYDAKCKLTADIDMEEADLQYFPIGDPGDNSGKRFVGTFDGQGHRISNLQLINPNAADGFGMFNTSKGVVLRNFWLDSSCKIQGNTSVGLIGRHNNGAALFEGIGNCGDVYGNNNNIGGLIGGLWAKSSVVEEVTIRNCWTMGKVEATVIDGNNKYLDCGALVSWFNNAKVTLENCWSVADVTYTNSEAKYFFRNGSGASFTYKNCYCMFGAQPNIAELTEEMLQGGELCWKLNDETFVDAVWHQTLGDEEYPMPYEGSGIVYQTTSGFDCVKPDDASSVASFISSIIATELDFVDATTACQSMLDAYKTEVESWEGITGWDEFMAAYKGALEQKEDIKLSAAKYKEYADACEAALTYLQENDLEGAWADLLKSYLEENVEPGTDFPNGSQAYVLYNLELNNEELDEEIAFVNQLLENAIAGGVTSGTEITRLFVNPTFAEGLEGWDTEGTGMKVGGNTDMPVAEVYNASPSTISQTLSEMPNGIYMATFNGLFRSGTDISSMFYAGQLFLNGTSNYFMSIGEDYVSYDDAEPGVNCLGDDGDANYNGDGYVPSSLAGASVAFGADRYINYCATKVTDGTLTVGARNLGTGLAKEWMPFAGMHVYYLGTEEEASEKLTDVLDGFVERAQVIYEFPWSFEDEEIPYYPNMSEDLKDELMQALDKAETAKTGAEKMELINTFSSIFSRVLDCRKAYISMQQAANELYDLLGTLDLAELISNEDYEAWSEKIDDARTHYELGDVSAERAYAIADELRNADIIMKSVDGVFQLATANDLRFFSVLVNQGATDAKAVLTADIDMTESAELFQPIGKSGQPFTGEFDGQGHKITGFGTYDEEADEYNLQFSDGMKGFFGYVKNATIKNFSIDGAFSYNSNHNGYGLIGWAEGSTLSDIHSNLRIASASTGKHIGGICGSMREGTTATRCSFSGVIIDNHNSHDCLGGIGGYSNENCAYVDCANYGSITFTNAGAYAGGICGYVNNDSFVGVSNCLSVGTVGMESGKPTYGGAIIGRLRSHANSVFQNNYVLDGSATRAYGDNATNATATNVSSEQLKSGEVCYKLNGDQSVISWFQTLGTDNYPMLQGEHLQVVYIDGTYTNGNPDGIQEISKDASAIGTTDAIYNLAGQRLSRMQKGINIVGGKKILVK